MRDAMIHRGPDDFGSHHDAGIFLGHRRLSILDHEGGHQPMSDFTGTVWIVFNGEIYNHRTLRKELEAKGRRFKTDHSDTEAIIAAFLEWGPACVERLEGMFAYALYDSRDHTLHIARDRLGIKPLYVWEGKGELVFASEIKAILQYPGFLAQLDPAAVSSYLSYRYVVGEGSFFSGVKKLLPGTIITVSSGQTRTHTYWSVPHPNPDEERYSEEQLEELGELMRASVGDRMMGDVPVGAYLSGGLDSSLIAALMAKISPKAVKTFTIGFREEGFNELEYAREVARHIRCDHREMILDHAGYFDRMPDLIRYKDEPLSVTNEVPLWQMSCELKKHFTVVLSGEGADELFAGYGRIFKSPFDLERMQALKNMTGENDGALRSLFDEAYGPRWPSTPSELFLHHYNWFSRSERENALTDEFLGGIAGLAPPESIFEEAFTEVAAVDVYDQFLWVFEKLHLPGLLARLDTTTMAASVEGRVPFVDHKLVEFALRVPFHMKQRWRSDADRSMGALELARDLSEKRDVTKALLRDFLKPYLPSRIIERQKMGFPVPVHTWFSGPYRDEALAILLDPSTRAAGIINCDRVESWLSSDEFLSTHTKGLMVWMLLNLAIWYREYLG